MALDRQSIERKDFPIGRRGYDRDAVDAHLRALADEIEELERSARPRSEPLAAVASEQVRSIVQAAETSAADIRRQAEDEACDYVGKVAESTTGILERIAAMENELAALIESLRTGCHRLNADVQLLEGDLASVKTAVVTRARFEPEPAGAAAATEAAAAPAPALEQAAPAVPTAQPFEASVGVVGAGAGEVLSDASAAPAPAGPANGAEDESARLIALNMVMNNTPREEIERYLAEHFRLSDRRGLLDEVYSSFQN